MLVTLVLAICSLLLSREAEAMHCLNCNAVLSPVLCHQIKLCHEGEICVTERYTTVNGERLYNLGCYPQNLCVSRGRRSQLNPNADLVQCTECCNGDACNKDGCGAGGLPTQSGPLCYNCQQSLDPQKCSVVRTCNQNELCHIKRVSELGFTFYATSCLARYNCPIQPVGKRKRGDNFARCCVGDLCNTDVDGAAGTLPPLITSGGSGGGPVGILIKTTPQLVQTTPADLKAKDCKELHDSGVDADGAYTIYPAGAAIKAYCDMVTENGGWTVILDKTYNNTEMFNRSWADYKNGFGKPDGEHWIGNDIIRALTQLGKTDVYFKLVDKNDHELHAKWKNVSVGPESDGYRLTFDRLSYDGDAGNTLNNTNPWYTHYGMKFTTMDKDSDTYNSGNCAELTKGAWWFSGCYSVDPTAMTPKNFVWSNENGFYELKHAVMMLRRE